MSEFGDNENVTVIADDFREVHELSAVDDKTSNWKGTLISILVILVLSSAILLAIYIINPDIQYKLYANPKEKLKLSELLNGNYSIQATFNGTWFSDSEITYIDSDHEFSIYDANTQNKSTILVAQIMKQHEIEKAFLSPDRHYVLLRSNVKHHFRHSISARYQIYDLDANKIIEVRPREAQNGVLLQAAEWGPIGSQLAFVYENNIYYLHRPNGTAVRLTDNNYKYIYNGIPDWIYEEEILAAGTAFWWSSDGNRLAFAQFNDTEVEFQEYPWYGDTTIDLDSQYLDKIKIKYPKPGSNNPVVKLFVVSLGEANSIIPSEVLPPSDIANREHYLTAVAWTNQDCLVAAWFTREQDYSSFSVCSPGGQLASWKCVDSYTKKAQKGWIDITNIVVDPELENYYILMPDDSPRQYVQILKVNTKTGNAHFLTSGRRDVTQISGVVKNPDGDGNVVFFMATREGKPGERHAYSVIDSVKNRSNRIHGDPSILRDDHHHPKDFVVECYTCDQIELNQCLSNRVSFSKAGTFFMQECQGPDIPYSRIRKTANLTAMNAIWESNEKLSHTLANKLLPTIKTELINKTDHDLIVQMMLPPNFNPERVVKYPLLIQVYAGPGSQMVSETFKMNFGKYLAGSKDIIYAYVDGRGSGFQGETMKHRLYHKLGTVEIEDQIIAAKYLRDHYKFINRDSIAIWGWSYGGYATAKALTKDVQDRVFACGISVAPVTSWLLYDSAYTERYMGIPKRDYNNTFKHYLDSDVIQSVDHFKGKKFLLIHGTADDNVHIQNSMILIKALNQANVLFQTQIYPDENHGLLSVHTHHYQTMENFWNECFKSDHYVEDVGLRRRRVKTT